MKNTGLTVDQTQALLASMQSVTHVPLTDDVSAGLYRTKAGSYCLTVGGSLLFDPDQLAHLGFTGIGSADYPSTDEAAIALLRTHAAHTSSAALGIGTPTSEEPCIALPVTVPAVAPPIAETCNSMPVTDTAYLMTEDELHTTTMDDLPGVLLMPHAIAAHTPIVPAPHRDLASDFDRIRLAIVGLSGAIDTIADHVLSSGAPIPQTATPIANSVALPATAIQQDPATGKLSFYLLLRPTDPQDPDDAAKATQELAELAVAGGYKRIPQGLELEQLETSTMGELWVLWEMSPGAAEKFGIACNGRIRTL